MRHQVAGYKLGRSKDQRTGLRRTMIRQLFDHERIQTTRAKAHVYPRRGRKTDHRWPATAARARDIEKVNARRLAAAKLGQ